MYSNDYLAEWIGRNEIPPLDQQKVIVCKNIDGKLVHDIAIYNHNSDIYSCEDSDCVTHWAHLLNLPNGGRW